MSVSFRDRLSNIVQAALGKENVLSSNDVMDVVYNGPEDDIIENDGVAGYFKMLRDAKISSNIDAVESLAIPDYSVVAGDDTDEAARNAEFIKAVLDAIPGSTLELIRNPFRNAIITGLTVAEIQYQLMELPGFGTVNGVSAIHIKPTVSFTGTNGIQIDKFGNILSFHQNSMYGGNTAALDEVIYYAFRGSSNNRYGTSLLHSVYDPWKAKQKIFRIYAMFMATNASGIRIAKLPKNSTKKQLEDAQKIMRKLSTAQSFAVLDTWDIDPKLPGAGAGGHFLEMIQEMDRQIAAGIVGDSAFSAQDQGSYSSRKVSQGNVQMRMRAWGNSYIESFSEQFCRQVLKANGFAGKPPIITADIAQNAEDRIEGYKVLGDLKQKGLVTIAIPETAQVQIANDLGVEITSIEQEIEPAPKPEPVVNSSEVIHAAAPSGRDNATLKRNGKQYNSLHEKGSADLVDTWQAIVPGILKKLEGQIFNPNLNGWKITDLNKLRSIAIDSVKYKSSEMRKSMDATLKTGNEMGIKHAQAMIPVKAAAGFTPHAVIQSLQNHTYLTLEQKYPKIASDVYYLLENAVNGDIAPNVVRAQIQNYLIEESVFTPGLANTIIETSLSSAYNDARMSLFRQIVDPTGKTPGMITGYVFSAIMDNYTTDICTGLDGKAFAADDPSLPQPPLHYNCRSQLIPVFSGEQPWTAESNGQFMKTDDSAALMTSARANGQIQKGFGGM